MHVPTNNPPALAYVLASPYQPNMSWDFVQIV
jgi:hypothetical protein